MARSSRRPPSSSLRRRTETRTPKKTVLVFCEGRRTEPLYLEALKQDPAVKQAASVDVRIAGQATACQPLPLVEKAVAAKIRNDREEGEIDEIWCVFDVEWPLNHPNLRSAVDLARSKRIRLAISNPCFELWLVLHYRDCNAWMTNDEARRARRQCDGQIGKLLSGAAYMKHKDEACRRAEALDARHKVNGVAFPQNNPSSGMYELLISVSTAAGGGLDGL